MNPIPAGVIPPPPGLEKEEPEFAEEDDVPADDERPGDGTSSTDSGSSRKIERE